jgi:hypothetical protein
MSGLLKNLVLPTFKLLAWLLAANVLFSIIVYLVSSVSPLMIIVNVLFIESGLMIVFGALIMVRTPKVESKGSKILLGGTVLFILDAALAFLLSATLLG